MMMSASLQKAQGTTNSGYTILKGLPSVGEELCHRLQFDGSADPNPGFCTSGAVVYAPSSSTIIFECGDVCQHGTNNQAEYTGLKLGLFHAKEFGIQRLLIEGDSELLVRQILGVYKVKHEGLKLLYKEVMDLIRLFEFVAIRHVYREFNTYADGITKQLHVTKKAYLKTT